MRMDGPPDIKWTDFHSLIDKDSPASKTAVIGQTGHDARSWTALHATVVNNPNQVRQLLHRHRGQPLDVDRQGPGGYTALMLAVTRRSGAGSCESVGTTSRTNSESSGDVAEFSALMGHKARLLSGGAKGGSYNRYSSGSEGDSPRLGGGASSASPAHSPTGAAVTALIDAGAKLDVVNDFGQTALHLAASCSRGDYVKQLLEASANPNAQDNWGQSALHVAIGASADGCSHVSATPPTSSF